MGTAELELLAIARRYCALVEALDEGDRAPLAQLNELLPKLHAAMTAVGPLPSLRAQTSTAAAEPR